MAAWNATASSWVMASTRSRSRRSRNRARVASICCQRPLACHRSAGCTTGNDSSWPPMRSISSRRICSMLRSARQPSGSSEKMPAANCRT